MKRILFTIIFLIIVQNPLFGQILTDCSSCSTKIIKAEQIKNLSIDEVRLLSNEIFAKNGYVFENYRFQNYFQQKAWYHPDSNKNITYNDIEKKNIAFFQNTIKSLKTRQIDLVNQLKSLKTQILNNQNRELKTNFGFHYEDLKDNEESKLLKEVFNKINLDDINYYKNNGLYKTITDNGFVKVVHEIYVKGDNVNISYNYMAHSEIIEDFDEFTDYHSENEFMYNWHFEYKNSRLQFIKLDIAG